MPRKIKKIRYKKTIIILLIVIALFLLFFIVPAPINGYWWISTEGQMKGCGNSPPYIIYSFGTNESKMYSVWKNEQNKLYISDEQNICGGSAMRKRGRQYVYSPPDADLSEFVITPGWLYTDFADFKKNRKNPHWQGRRSLNPFFTNKLLEDWERRKEKDKAYQDRIR